MVRSLLAATVLAVGVYAQAAADGPKINTPSSLVTCQPSKLTWSGGSPPYFVSVIPGGEPGGAPLKDFGQVQGTEQTWIVDLPSGTSVSLKVKDSQGNENYAEKVSITGSDTSCLNGDAAAAAPAAGSSDAAAPSGDAAAPAAADASAAPAGADSSAAASPAAAGSAAPAAGSAAPAGTAAPAAGSNSAAKPSGSAAAPAAASGSAAAASTSAKPNSAASSSYVASAALGVAGVVAAALF